MKIVFFGTSDYCLPVIESLNSNFELKLVITRPDKPEGRKQLLTPSATKLWAIKKGIQVATPETLKKDTPDRLKLKLKLETLNPDLAVISDYGLIIPEAIFQTPRLGTINVHFSRLPDLRGPSPVQFSLLRGDKDAWVTIFKLENPPDLAIKMDSGPIIDQRSFSKIDYDTTETLYKRLFKETSKYLPLIITGYSTKTPSLIAQDHTKANFCRFLTKDDGFIEWPVLQKAMNDQRLTMNELPKIQEEALATIDVIARNATTKQSVTYQGKQIASHSLAMTNSLYNFYRAVTPWPGMWTIHPNGKRMKVLQCHLEENKLVLDQIQFEGKRPSTIIPL